MNRLSFFQYSGPTNHKAVINNNAKKKLKYKALIFSTLMHYMFKEYTMSSVEYLNTIFW
jgi:hypothetical protein